MSYLIFIGFGLFTGVTSSLFGFGGGFIIVPLIYHMLPDNQYSMQIAIATSLGVMIVNSLFATYKYHRTNDILWNYNFPLAYYIGLGSIVGAYLATKLTADTVRYLFIIYILYVVVYCLIKKNFVNQNRPLTKLSTALNMIVGGLIGIVASALGVGGSVMTVPLMRRLGLSMRQSSAIANPLSLPIAVVGATTYILIGAHESVNFGNEYAGLVYLPALIILSICGLIGVPFGTYLAHKISDVAHARGFIILLIIALITMLI